MPVRIARVEDEEREGHESEREAAPARHTSARGGKREGPEEEERREHEEALRGIEEKPEEEGRGRQADPEETRAGELTERRRALEAGREREGTPEADRVVGGEERREGGAARGDREDPARRGKNRAEEKDRGGDGRGVLRENREAEQRPAERVPSRAPSGSGSEERRPRPEEAGGDERMREEEEPVREERRRKEERRRREAGTRGRGAEPEGGSPEDECEDESRQRRSEEPHEGQGRAERRAGGRSHERAGEEVARQRDEGGSRRLVRVHPAVPDGDVLERGAEERENRRDLGRPALGERGRERPPRDFVGREEVREHRDDEEREQRVEGDGRSQA